MISNTNFLPDVQDVAHSFSQAAKNYDQVADLQRLVADQLITKGAGLHQGRVLDIGSGTGYVKNIGILGDSCKKRIIICTQTTSQVSW